MVRSGRSITMPRSVSSQQPTTSVIHLLRSDRKAWSQEEVPNMICHELGQTFGSKMISAQIAQSEASAHETSVAHLEMQTERNGAVE